MTENTERKNISSYILQILACVLCKRTGRGMNAGKSEHIVLRLIPAVLTIRQNTDTVSAVRISNISPLLSGNLIKIFTVIRSVNITESQIVGSNFVRASERKLSLEQSSALLPVYTVINPYNLASALKAYNLLDLGKIGITSNLNCNS